MALLDNLDANLLGNEELRKQELAKAMAVFGENDRLQRRIDSMASTVSPNDKIPGGRFGGQGTVLKEPSLDMSSINNSILGAGVPNQQQLITNLQAPSAFATSPTNNQVQAPAAQEAAPQEKRGFFADLASAAQRYNPFRLGATALAEQIEKQAPAVQEEVPKKDNRLSRFIDQVTGGQSILGAGGPTAGYVTTADSTAASVLGGATVDYLTNPDLPTFSESIMSQADKSVLSGMSPLEAAQANAVSPVSDSAQMTGQQILGQAGVPNMNELVSGIQEMGKPTSPGFDITFERDGRTFAIPKGGSVQDAFIPTAAQLQQFDAFQKAQPGFQAFQGGAATGPVTPAPADMQRTIDPGTGDIIFADPATAGQFGQQILAQRQREQELTPGVMANLQQGAAALRGTAGQPMTQAQLDAASQARTDRIEEARQRRIRQEGGTATTELPSSIVSILNTPQSQQTQEQRDRLSRFATNQGTTIGALEESQRGPLETERDVSALDSAALQREATQLNMLAQRGNILGAEQRRRLAELEIEKVQRELDNPTVDSPSVAETKALLDQYGVAKMKDVRLKDANTLQIGNTTIKMNTPEGQQALRILQMTLAGRAILQALTTPGPNIMQDFKIAGRSGAGEPRTANYIAGVDGPLGAGQSRLGI